MPLLAASFAVALLQSPPQSDRQLHSDLTRILSEERLVGAAWATVEADGSIRVDAAGYRDGVARVPFSAATRFHVGSVAKAVLATGVLRLVTEGRIRLDDPVTRFLPSLPVRNPWQATRPVTVRHLLDHTSGLDDMRLRQMFSSRVAPDMPLAQAFAGSDLLRVRVPPGSRVSYSNMGYTVLGMIIESVTGTRYEDYLDTQLLAPLGMHNSTFRFTTQEGSAADTALAWGHLDAGERHAALPIALRPAAQLTTTAHDLALFARFLMSDGSVGTQLVSPDLMRARGTTVGTDAANAGLVAGYALGLARRDRYGAVGFCHNGNTVGFVANICVYPTAEGVRDRHQHRQRIRAIRPRVRSPCASPALG